MFKGLIILLFMTLLSCQGRIAIFSNPPGAEVFVNNKVIGKTPLRIDPDALEPVKTAQGYLVRVGHEGYSPIWVLVPESTRKFELRLKLNQFAVATDLRKDASGAVSSFGREGPAVADRFQKDLAELLRLQALLMNDSKIDTAQISNFKKVFPDAGGPWFLDGLDKYRNGDMAGAQAAMDEAMQRNAWDSDFLAVTKAVKQAAKKTEEAPAPDDSK